VVLGWLDPVLIFFWPFSSLQRLHEGAYK